MIPRLVMLVALCAPVAAQTDWVEAVEKANKHRRYALRLAAAKKVARAGDAAVEAVRAFEQTHGKGAIVQSLVDAIARGPGNGVKTVELLEHWAFDREFYWRSHALHGLAVRELPEQRGAFERGLQDPSHLFRIESARGLIRFGGEHRERALALLSDADPRARLGVALALLERDDDAGLPEAVSALGRTTRFLDDPWGERLARRAAKALIAFANRDGVEGDFGMRADPAAGMAAIVAWARERMTDPPAALDPEADPPASGGFEVRSCRNGDLFCRWDEEGQLWFGLERPRSVRLPADVWRDLRAAMPSGTGVAGPVICDFLRMQGEGTDRKYAPDTLSQTETEWLASFAQAMEGAGETELAAAVRSRVEQFAR